MPKKAKTDKVELPIIAGGVYKSAWDGFSPALFLGDISFWVADGIYDTEAEAAEVAKSYAANTLWKLFK